MKKLSFSHVNIQLQAPRMLNIFQLNWAWIFSANENKNANNIWIFNIYKQRNFTLNCV